MGKYREDVLNYLGARDESQLSVIYSIDDQEELHDISKFFTSKSLAKNLKAKFFDVGMLDYGVMKINGKSFKAVAHQNASPIGILY